MTDTDTVDRIPVGDLALANITDAPRDFDFSVGYPDAWDFWEAVACDGCGADIFDGTEHEHVAPTADNPADAPYSELAPCPNDGLDARDLYAEGPMMNYLYPVDLDDHDPETVAKAIVDLPLCVVDIGDGSYYFALTGGGMDLSWEIADAYTRVGQLPPAHFAAHLPRMANNRLDRADLSPADLYIVEACERSLVEVADIAQRRLDHWAWALR